MLSSTINLKVPMTTKQDRNEKTFSLSCRPLSKLNAQEISRGQSYLC